MTGFYADYARAMDDALRRVDVTGARGASLDIEEAFEVLRARVDGTRDSRGFLYFCGNGASAAMSSHFSVDWMKNAGVRSAVFTDTATLTAYGNDTGYDNVFAGPISRVGGPNDALVTVSSSGNSPNVLKAIEAARAAGMFVITLSGFKADNRSRALGDINFYVPGATYGVVECAHQVILHAWLDHYMRMPARLIE